MSKVARHRGLSQTVMCCLSWAHKTYPLIRSIAHAAFTACHLKVQLWQSHGRVLQCSMQLAAAQARLTVNCSASCSRQDRPQQEPNSTVCLPTSLFAELLPAQSLIAHHLCLVLAVQQRLQAEPEPVLQNWEACPAGPAIAGDLKLCLLVIQVCQL